MPAKPHPAAIAFLLLATAILLGCQPEPKPITTGAKPGKTYVGVDPATEAQMNSVGPELPRPTLPRPSATGVPGDSSRVTVQYQSPSFERPLSEISDKEIAAESLARIGPPAVPSLVQALQHRDPEVRREATRVLMRMGPDAKAAAPELTRLLDDEDEMVRKYAAKALGNIGPDAAVAVPALMLDLLQPSPDVPGQGGRR